MLVFSCLAFGVIQAILPGGLSIVTVFFRARSGDHIPAVQGRTKCKEEPGARKHQVQGSTIGQEARQEGKDAISGSAVKTQIQDQCQPTPR